MNHQHEHTTKRVSCAPVLQPAPHGATHDKLTSGKILRNGLCFLPRAAAFVCHRHDTVRIFSKFPTLIWSIVTSKRRNLLYHAEPACSSPPLTGAVPEASSSLR